MTNSDIFPMYNITTGTVMLICAIDSLFVLQNPNLTQPTQIILVLKKQSPRVASSKLSLALLCLSNYYFSTLS